MTLRTAARALVACVAGLGLAYVVLAAPILGFKVSETGDLGVGTDDPQFKLHVEGDAFSSGAFRGAGYQGQYAGAALIQGFDLQSGLNPRFLLGKNPQGTISIVDVGTQTFKTFVIDHPDPARRDRYLVHATLEGPEGAVFYRGTAELVDGEATVELPEYFERLTRRGDRTILLTNVGGFDPLAVRTVAGEDIRYGAFHVYSSNPHSSQRFHWEVKAVRQDAPPLEVEPSRDEVLVRRFGPYAFGTPARPREGGAGPARGRPGG